MDTLDLKILKIFDFQARMPLSKIARLIRANKDVVAYRVKRLEEKGLIVRYYPVLDLSTLDYHTFRLYFDLEEMGELAEKDFVAFLDQNVKAGLIFRMDYPYRYGVFVWVKNVYVLDDLLKKIKQKLGKTLRSYNCSLICSLEQFPKDYLFENKNHEQRIVLSPSHKEKVDPEDLKILEALAQNARRTTTEIAKDIGIAQSTVSYKIRSLQKRKVILGYRAEINFAALGYTNYFLEVYLEDNSCLSSLEGWARMNPHVVWLQRIVGTCDIEIEVEVKGRLELEDLLRELRNRFPAIRKIVFWAQEYKKLTFLPA